MIQSPPTPPTDRRRSRPSSTFRRAAGRRRARSPRLRWFRSLPGPLALVVLVGCDDADRTTPSEPDRVRQVEVGAPLPSIQVGDTMRLSAVARNGTGTAVQGVVFSWNSSDTLVARVSASGLLRAVAPGTAAIRASASGHTGEVRVSVREPPPPVPTLRTLSPSEVLERSGDHDLVVEGAEFRAGSRVLWNEIPLGTTFVSETSLVARIPGAFVGQPLEVAIAVETVAASEAGSSPRSGTQPFRVLPRPLASVHLHAAGNHVFTGQVLEHEISMRNDLGEEVAGPGLGFSIGDESVLAQDWAGNLVGRAPGTTTLRASVGDLSSELVITVDTAPIQRLVVVARPQGIPELFLLDFGRLGSQERRFERILPEGTRAAEPAVSPDGSRIAFTGTAADGSVNVWTVRIDGTDLRRLTNDAFRGDQPAWSPDGARLAIRSFRRGIPEIWVMNADGSGPLPLLEHPTMIPGEENHHPAWLPDGRSLVFSRSVGAELTLHVARVDHGIPVSQVTQLLHIPGFHAERPAPAPEGGHLAFEARDRFTGEVRILFASAGTGEVLHPLNPPAQGVRRPTILVGDWLAAIGPSGLEGHSVPTLRIQELNGLRLSVPVPSWVGGVEGVAGVRR